MRVLPFILFSFIFFLALNSLQAGEKVTEKTTTKVNASGEIVKTTDVNYQGSDSLAVGDPYGNGPLSQQALHGPANTRKPCTAGSTAPNCLRAKKRQLSSPYWKPGTY